MLGGQRLVRLGPGDHFTAAPRDEEWSIAERRYFSVEAIKQLSVPALPPTAQLASIA